MNTFLTADLFGCRPMSYMIGIRQAMYRRGSDKRPSQVVLAGGRGAL